MCPMHWASASTTGRVTFDTAILQQPQAFRDEVRAFLDEHLTEELDARRRAAAVNTDVEFLQALGARGWLEPRWRKEDGGAELDDVCVKILETELHNAEAPALIQTTTDLVKAELSAIVAG